MSCIPAFQGGAERRQTHPGYERDPGQGCDQTEEPGREVMKESDRDREREIHTEGTPAVEGSGAESGRQTEGCSESQTRGTHTQVERHREKQRQQLGGKQSN